MCHRAVPLPCFVKARDASQGTKSFLTVVSSQFSHLTVCFFCTCFIIVLIDLIPSAAPGGTSLFLLPPKMKKIGHLFLLCLSPSYQWCTFPSHLWVDLCPKRTEQSLLEAQSKEKTSNSQTLLVSIVLTPRPRSQGSTRHTFLFQKETLSKYSCELRPENQYPFSTHYSRMQVGQMRRQFLLSLPAPPLLPHVSPLPLPSQGTQLQLHPSFLLPDS